MTYPYTFPHTYSYSANCMITAVFEDGMIHAPGQSLSYKEQQPSGHIFAFGTTHSHFICRSGLSCDFSGMQRIAVFASHADGSDPAGLDARNAVRQE